MTQRITIGTLRTQDGQIQVSEEPPTREKLAEGGPFNVTMDVDNLTLSLSLVQVRTLKRLLLDAERILVLRQEETLRARNLNLDL